MTLLLKEISAVLNPTETAALITFLQQQKGDVELRLCAYGSGSIVLGAARGGLASSMILQHHKPIPS